MVNKRTVFHVVPDATGTRWLVTQEGNDSRPDSFESKELAVEAAKKLAQAHGPSLLQVHSRDGAIEYESSYEEDPLVRQLAEYGF